MTAPDRQADCPVRLAAHSYLAASLEPSYVTGTGPWLEHVRATEHTLCEALAAPCPLEPEPSAGPWELTHPTIMSGEGEQYEGAAWHLTPKVGATVAGIACTFPADCEREARAVCNLLNQLAGSSPEWGTAAPKEGKP